MGGWCTKPASTHRMHTFEAALDAAKTPEEVTRIHGLHKDHLLRRIRENVAKADLLFENLSVFATELDRHVRVCPPEVNSNELKQAQGALRSQQDAWTTHKNLLCDMGYLNSKSDVPHTLCR
jgi:hypothetical protein